MMLSPPTHINSLHQLFEEQVQKTPNNLSIAYQNVRISYHELNQAANQLASYLRFTHKIGTNNLVTLYLSPSQYLPIAILAVLKTGAAYVPIDPTHPLQRIKTILQDTQAYIVITDLKHENHLSTRIQKEKLNIHPLIIENVILSQKPKNCLATNLNIPVNANDLAYVMYTSGSTGKPKGVMVEHGAIVNKLKYLINTHNIDAEYNILNKAPYVFDPSLREIFLALLTGAKLVIADENSRKAIDLLLELCIKESIHLIVFVPSQLRLFIDASQKLDLAKLGQIKLKLLYSCGERLAKQTVCDLQKLLPNLTIKNQYGPTEACMFSCEYNITQLAIPEAQILIDYPVADDAVKLTDLAPEVPIGKPIAN